MSSKAKPKPRFSSDKVAPVAEWSMADTLSQNYMPYAMSVIVSRAIPEIDGFKPSHRKLLYTMYKMNLMGGARAKSADVVGQTMALNPHGDLPIYETLVRLTRGNGALIHPWVDSKGNFGRVFSRDMRYAASRYTEVRLDPSASLLFEGLTRDAVDFVDNYSATMKEPVLLPVKLPTILINANQGIAVGMASHICSFNLREMCRATAALIDDPDVDLLDVVPAPDFSTGGALLYDRDEMARLYATGRGAFQLQATYRIEPKAQRIVVTEIPYTTTIEAILDETTALAKAGKLRELSDVRDETDLSGLALSFEYKRNVDPDLLLQKLLAKTSLRSNFSANFNVLIDGRPQVLGVKPLLSAWLDWRERTVARELTHQRATLEAERHRLRALALIVLDIDRAIAIIRETAHERDVVARLMEAFAIDQTQADYVAEIKLRHLNRETILRRTAALEALDKEISSLSRTIASKARIRDVIKRDLLAIAERYGRDRQTRLVPKETIKTMTDEAWIDDYNVRVVLTREGYLKKLPLTSLRGANELKIKEGDETVVSFDTSNKSVLFLVSSAESVYRLPLYALADHKPSDLGEYATNCLDLGEGETIVWMCPLDEAYPGELIFFFANGKAVRIPWSRYATKSNRKKLVRAYSNCAPLVAVEHTDKPREYVVETSNGRRLIVPSERIVAKTTRTSQGGQVVRLAKRATVVRAVPADTFREDDLKPYRVHTIPSSGKLIGDHELVARQLRFDT